MLKSRIIHFMLALLAAAVELVLDAPGVVGERRHLVGEEFGVLALIVVIRTFLSFSLEVELQGRWPWRARRDEPAPSSPTSD